LILNSKLSFMSEVANTQLLSMYSDEIGGGFKEISQMNRAPILATKTVLASMDEIKAEFNEPIYSYNPLNCTLDCNGFGSSICSCTGASSTVKYPGVLVRSETSARASWKCLQQSDSPYLVMTEDKTTLLSSLVASCSLVQGCSCKNPKSVNNEKLMSLAYSPKVDHGAGVVVRESKTNVPHFSLHEINFITKLLRNPNILGSTIDLTDEFNRAYLKIAFSNFLSKFTNNVASSFSSVLGLLNVSCKTVPTSLAAGWCRYGFKLDDGGCSAGFCETSSGFEAVIKETNNSFDALKKIYENKPSVKESIETLQQVFDKYYSSKL